MKTGLKCILAALLAFPIPIVIAADSSADDSRSDKPATKPSTRPTTGPTSAPADAKGKTDPAGLPLEAKLILKKDTYQIAPGESGESFAKVIRAGAPAGSVPPAPPLVDMALELTNTGDKAVTIPFGGDDASIDLKLEGPGAVTAPYFKIDPGQSRAGTPMKIEPGKSFTLSIRRLAHGFRGGTTASYWTSPGTYTLTASYTTPIGGLDLKKHNLKEGQAVTITAAPVNVKVTAPPDKPTAAPTTVPAPPPAEEIDNLVAQLDAEGFKDREAAQKKLERLGAGVLPALKEKLKSGKLTPEVKSRVEAIIEKLSPKPTEPPMGPIVPY